MELQIQDLVSSIKKEGIDAAAKEAETIIAEAKAKAEKLLADAKAEAKAAKDTAEKEIAAAKAGAEISAEQAKRDAMLAFKAEVQAEFEKILSAKAGEAMQGEALGKLIAAALQGEDVAAYTAEVTEVTEGLKAALAEEIKGGLEIRPAKYVKAGFRLAAKDGSGYFDCSDEEIMKMLMPYFRNMNF